MVTDDREKKISLLLEDLSSLETYIRDLFVFAPLPICFISPRGVILEANPTFEKMANLPTAEIIGASVTNFFKENEIRKLEEDTFKSGFLGGREMIFLPRGKKEIYVQAISRAREDEEGVLVGYFLSLFDLTDVKKKEKSIKETQSALLNILEDTEESRRAAEEERNKTEAIINNFADGLLVFDLEKRLVSVNPQAEIFFALKAKEITGKPLKELTAFAPLNALTAILTEELKEVFRKELPLLKDFILEVSTIPVLREKERLGTLVILHDISREKRIERMKTEFVSIAAHQLRTPLSAIKWTLKMLLDGDLGEVTLDQREFIENCYLSNERMIRLINDLLDVTRIEEGRYIYKQTSLRLETIIQSVIDTYAEEIRRRRIKFEFKKPEEKTAPVRVDAEKIKLVVENLIDNAIRYTLPEGKVTVSLEKTKDNLEVSVKDSGVGIPADQRERVFTKFFRGANVMRLETEGSGLGLFIARNIIEAHHGTVWFESEEGSGSTFHFTLPIYEELTEFVERL